MITTYSTKYQGATDSHGTRIRVTNTRTGKHRFHSWDYSVNGGQTQHLLAVEECTIRFGDLEISGETAHGYYVTLTTRGDCDGG